MGWIEEWSLRISVGKYVAVKSRYVDSYDRSDVEYVKRLISGGFYKLRQFADNSVGCAGEKTNVWVKAKTDKHNILKDKLNKSFQLEHKHPESSVK